MKLKELILRIIPTPLRRTRQLHNEKKELQRIPRFECDVKYLKSIDNVALKELFASHEIEMEWDNIKKRIDTFVIPDMTGGVNPGDRKAIYSLISGFKPSSVLEIGTHIGASTLHIASALFMSQIKDGKHAHLVSVDIADVNDPISKPWLKYGTDYSPVEMIEKMAFGSFVEFVRDTSLHYFDRCKHKFDFIFLDGDHAAKAVYQEIPAALNALNKDGVILLHDYFPNLKPLWSDGSVIPGPFLAAERLKAEGTQLVVLSLGELPWPTKLQSNITSLALLSRNEH
jgi:predicted O-methyltransferase YrrM